MTFDIKSPSVSGKKISLKFRGGYVVDTSYHYMSDILNVTTTALVDEQGNAVNRQLPTQVSMPSDFFGQVSFYEHNQVFSDLSVSIFVLDDFKGTAEVKIVGQYSGLAASVTVTL